MRIEQPLYIRRAAGLYFDARDGVAQPELNCLLREQCRGRYRRIDRFTQLALLGSARCAAGVSLKPQSPLYLASGKGPAGNNIEMQRAIIEQQEPPKPVQFINAVSNSASFYVMQEHQLAGQNLFVSRELHAFEAALVLLGLDFAAQRAHCALLGMVDEITHPLSEQRLRLGVGAETALGEGSYWFLCDARRHAESLGCIRLNTLCHGHAALLQSLAGLASAVRTECEVFFAHGMPPAMRDDCLAQLSPRCKLRASAQGLWDGLSAAALEQFLHEDGAPYLLSISCDTEARSHLLLLQRL